MSIRYTQLDDVRIHGKAVFLSEKGNLMVMKCVKRLKYLEIVWIYQLILMFTNYSTAKISLAIIRRVLIEITHRYKQTHFQNVRVVHDFDR